MIITTLGAQAAGIPYDTLGIGAGWFLLSLFLIGFYRGVSNGTLVTRREVESKDKRIDHLEQTVDELTKQNGILLRESVPTANAVMGALHQALENEEGY